MEIGVYREPSVARRKRAGATCKVFDVPRKTEFFAVGTMSGGPDRGRMLHERFRSELVAVRDLLQKVAAALPPSSPSPSAPRARGNDGRGFLATVEPRSEEPPAKRRKVSPLPVVKKTEAPKKMTPAEREDLAADLAEFSAELPAHVVELLQKQNYDRGGEIEIDLHAMEGAAVLELQKQLDKFVEERNHRHRAIGASGGVIHGRSPAQQRQDVKIVVEEGEQEDDINIVGGVSPLVIAPPPLQVAEEEDEYVDICGDASPAVMPQNLGEDETRGSSSHSDSDSDSSSSGSDCSDSDLDTDSSSDESVSSLAPESSSQVAEDAATLERRRRQEEREQAREKLVEMERTAMGGTNSIHPMVLQRLGIAQNQYMVSPASCLRRLGLFLKADDDDGVEEGLEEGEILL